MSTSHFSPEYNIAHGEKIKYFSLWFTLKSLFMHFLVLPELIFSWNIPAISYKKDMIRDLIKTDMIFL